MSESPEAEESVSGSKSIITIERPKRGGLVEKIDIEIPFSDDEAENIRGAYQMLKSNAVRSDMASGSGAVRQLVLATPVPWGHSLKDRGKALERIRNTYDAADAIIRKPPASSSQEVVTEITKCRDFLGKVIGITEEENK